ncbi:hypothetical protein GCM10010967_56020 [Dyadobacter beijingensis]|uniref:Histidine kinase domain-containing protein n=1 Tax=Dyadobacter beijingensis TaxID=365489 RepID=A0ABQ2IIG6_9BACT|nr:two-component regulator propeller domain-containing protein [Dyadobacter beijingensis]GGN12816.1 hypothetical protein GCM10010967_56020 [Dyadobacter beijingensis]
MKILYPLYLSIIACLLPHTLLAGETSSWALTHFNSENGLPQNSVNQILMDKDGYLWLTTQAGIVRYDGQRFRVFDKGNTALVRNRYYMLGEDEGGRMYCTDDYLRTSFYDRLTAFSKPRVIPGMVHTKDQGLIDLNRLDLGNWSRLTQKFSHSKVPDMLNFLYHPAGKEKGFLVFMNDIAYVSNGKLRWTQSPDSARKCVATGVVGEKLCHITKDAEVFLIDSNGVRSRLRIPGGLPLAGSQATYTSVGFFSQGAQTLLNLNGDIYEVGLAGNELKLRLLITVKEISHITCVRYYRHQGLLVIGSNTQGLFIFRKKQLVAVGDDALSGSSFYALAPYGENRIVSVVGKVPGSPQVPGVVDAVNRFSMLRDRKNHYWYGNFFTLVESDEQFRVLRKVPLTQWFGCVQEDENGKIWVNQGENNFGWVQGGQFFPYKLEGLGEKHIESFIPLGNQTFWIVGEGICMWVDVKNHRQRIYHQFDQTELRTVYRDKKGNLWLGSYGQGYFLFRNGRFSKMPEDEAHHLKIVHSFLEDDKGFIWMTTNNGLFQCAVKDLHDYASGQSVQVYQHFYGKESGLKTTEFNGGCTPSGLRLANGTFAFPSMNGVVVFHPDSIRPSLPANKIFIEQVSLDGKQVGTPTLSHIAPTFRRLEFTISSPFFGSTNNLNIKYNIEGLDDRWYPLPENDRIVLNTLTHGHYKLRLRKEGGFGTGNYIMAELPLVVMPFFYQTWWFYLLVAALIIAAVVVIVKIRYRYLLRQRNRLETEVKDRTRELAYQSKLMEKLTVSIAHDLKSPLYFLSKVTGHLRDNVQRENFNGIQRTSGEIKNTADQVYQFVEEFNMWASSFTEGFSVNINTFPLEGLLQELGLFFKEMLDANSNRLIFPADAHYTLETDRELLKVILRNIIDNANKHSRGCDITIAATAEAGGNVAITIADTGDGMSEPVLKRIHDRIAQASTAAGIERNSRLGYQMIIDFANRLDAKLDVRSERGVGTSVTLRIQGKVNGERLSSDLAQEIVGAG